MGEAFPHGEIALEQHRHSRHAFAGAFQGERGRDAKADFHDPAGRRHRETLHQDPIRAGGGDEHRIAPLLNGNLLIGLARLRSSGKRGLAFLAVDPEREPRHHGPGWQENLRPRFAWLRRVVAEFHRPLGVTPRGVGVDRGVESRAVEEQALDPAADALAAMILVPGPVAESRPDAPARAHGRRRHGIEGTARDAKINVPRLLRRNAAFARQQPARQVRIGRARGKTVACAEQRFLVTKGAQPSDAGQLFIRLGADGLLHRGLGHQHGRGHSQQREPRQPGAAPETRQRGRAAEVPQFLPQEQSGHERDHRGERQQPESHESHAEDARQHERGIKNCIIDRHARRNPVTPAEPLAPFRVAAAQRGPRQSVYQWHQRHEQGVPETRDRIEERPGAGARDQFKPEGKRRQHHAEDQQPETSSRWRRM
jgi:hypothetical protein